MYIKKICLKKLQTATKIGNVLLFLKSKKIYKDVFHRQYSTFALISTSYKYKPFLVLMAIDLT